MGNILTKPPAEAEALDVHVAWEDLLKKTISSFESIDDYIATFPNNIREILQNLRTAIRRSAPDAYEKISYHMPTFAQDGNLVHFAAFKNHIGFYPTSRGIEAFKKELSGYEYSKGAIRFPINKPLPYALITRIVAFRVDENLKKSQAKSRKGR